MPNSYIVIVHSHGVTAATQLPEQQLIVHSAHVNMVNIYT